MMPEWTKELYFLDFEATSAHFNHAQILEVAIATYAGYRYETLVDANVPIPAGASNTNKIIRSDLQGAPDSRSVLRWLSKFLSGKTIVAHNGLNYDSPVLACEMDRYGIKWDVSKCETLDTLVLARIAWPHRRYSMECLCNEFEIDAQGLAAHSAMGDVVRMMRLFELIYEELQPRTLANLLAMQAQARKKSKLSVVTRRR